MFAIDDLFNKCLQLTGENGAQLVDRFGSSSSIGYWNNHMLSTIFFNRFYNHSTLYFWTAMSSSWIFQRVSQEVSYAESGPLCPDTLTCQKSYFRLKAQKFTLRHS